MAREEQRRAVVEEETLKMPQQGWEVGLVPKGFGEGTPMCRGTLRFLSPAIPIVSEPRTPSRCVWTTQRRAPGPEKSNSELQAKPGPGPKLERRNQPIHSS